MVTYRGKRPESPILEINLKNIAYYLASFAIGTTGALAIHFAEKHFENTPQYTAPIQETTPIERDPSPSSLENTADS